MLLLATPHASLTPVAQIPASSPPLPGTLLPPVSLPAAWPPRRGPVNPLSGAARARHDFQSGGAN
ncbi:MAG: hypothetical protein ACRD9L_04020 [Bryobacteraceae bacterium]